MELASVLIKKQEERKQREFLIASLGSETIDDQYLPANRNNNRFPFDSAGEVTVTFGGQVIGQLQSITYDIDRDTAPIGVTREEYEIGRGIRGISGSLIIDDGVLDLSAFHSMLMGERVSVEYSHYTRKPYQNRKERRAKPKNKVEKERQGQQNRQNLMKAMGVRNKWN